LNVYCSGGKYSELTTKQLASRPTYMKGEHCQHSQEVQQE